MRKYATRNEAIETEITQPIEASDEITSAYDHFDIATIADLVLADYHDGYQPIVSHDKFWEIVEANELPKRLNSTELRRARYALGLSKSSLAARLHVRVDTLRNWENGRSGIPHRVREELAQIARERSRDAGLLASALEEERPFLTPETVIETKGQRLALHEVQAWLRDGNTELEDRFIANLRAQGVLDETYTDLTSLLDTLPALTQKDLCDLLDDPDLTIVL